jgi:ribonuclease R
LRHLDLITIDPDDAKDFDDAITASPTEEGGWDVWVAIADVAAYVTPDSPLDIAARLKGNSVYLPDTVEPMLPHILSSNLCSLKPNEDRACLAVNILFNENGEKVSHRFCRGIMSSNARLTYMQAQESYKNNYGEHTQTVNKTIQNIFRAYASLKNAREKRAPLNIELPERKVHIDKKGNVSSITIKERFDAHKLVEEFMIQANVAAAEALSEKNIASLSRLHEPPKREKLGGLADYLSVLGLKLSAGERATTQKLNALLKIAETKGLSESVGMAVLRSQSQAIYDAERKGHFGLNLSHYTHFTSPIRRYSDLIVHRALIKAFDLGEDGSTKSEISRLKETAEHISNTERRAMAAERDAKDRYIASYLDNKVGVIFDARITGVTKFGLFITLDETGADGLIPSRSLGREYFIHDEKRKSLIGSDSGKTYKFGRKIKAKLVESTPITGGLIFEMQSKPDKGPIPKIRNLRRDDYSKRKRRKNKK